ncbi:conserved hypothetical protein [Leishmania braziliensis MHOM/BR/75/M2904]|uniref:Uncharacterized protein n=2 Tax=Leishmania braziliensis TaxID=5660 RepID=A4H7C4_LEIBR|nr:conserved hypothetical protein [Leishmania braziliensis MHOM/BR/75/M2904]CAJ2468809.1 unnamed protein product [Leishmania braziliensis]CAM45682.1 conserved hypothetical protein [Leishmania braziliensis MHOM/BR/75/M2904]SYZ63947.1 hypothetical_protein [Leishmania braziliensis MHOM/BR/75/M2904]
MSSALIANILAKVEVEVRQRLRSTAASTTPGPSPAAAPLTSLSLLTSEDWSAVRCSLRADPTFPPSAAGATNKVEGTSASLQPVVASELLRYVQMRCAELPMRLQIEALQARRYEHLLRQHTRELVTLSEYMALVSRTPPTLAAVPRGVSEPTPNVAQLPVDVRALLAEEEMGPRLERCRVRIRELETMARQDAEAKVRCCQRMVLLSEFVRALVRHVTADVLTCKGAPKCDGATVTKRPRTEQSA